MSARGIAARLLVNREFVQTKVTHQVRPANGMLSLVIEKFGGAKRDRTADRYNVIVAVRSRDKIIFDTKDLRFICFSCN